MKCSQHRKPKHIPVIVKSHSDDVKLIKRGTDIWHQQHCPNCGSVFKYKDSAKHKVTERSKGLIREQVKWLTTKRTQDILETENIVVKCPLCGYECVVDIGFAYRKVGEVEL